MKDRDRNYRLLHITFQEYFAAQYFVPQWKSRKPLRCLNLSNGENNDMEPATFHRKHKYNARYDILWRFIAGLFDVQGGEYTFRFFQTIEEEPRDILGPTHQRLVMHYLSEMVQLKEGLAFTQYAERSVGPLGRDTLSHRSTARGRRLTGVVDRDEIPLFSCFTADHGFGTGGSMHESNIHRGS
jgi:hypothetical protein